MRPCSFYFIYPRFSQSDFNHRLSSKLIMRFLRFQETGPPSYPWFHHLTQKHQAPAAAAAKVCVSNYGLTHQRTCAINLSNISRPELHPQWDHLYRICTRWDLSQSCIHCCSGCPRKSDHSLTGSAAPVTGFTVKAPLKLSRPSLGSLPSPTWPWERPMPKHRASLLLQRLLYTSEILRKNILDTNFCLKVAFAIWLPG